MTFKMTSWAFGLLFVGTLWNAVAAYTAMGDVNVQGRFQEIGLLEGAAVKAEFPVPTWKPLQTQALAVN